MKKNLLSVAVKGALGLTAAAIMVPTTPAFAQDDAALVEEVVVTGSRIKRETLNTAGQTVTIDRSDIDISGNMSVADVLRETSLNALGSFSERSGSSAQSNATVNLRGAGSDRTLVLINGRRVTGSPSLGGGGSVNLNMIPMDAVERIEILADGASSTYGSDAIAGVVNLIMRKNFEGVSFKSRVGRPSQEGGDEESVSFVFGATGDRVSVTSALEFNSRDEIYDADRDYTAARWADENGDGYIDIDTETVGVSRYARAIWDPVHNTWAAPGSTWNPTTELWEGADCESIGEGFINAQYKGGNVCGYAHALISANRASLKRANSFTSAEFNIDDNWKAYTDVLFSRVESFGRYAPPAAVFDPMPANHPDNPTGEDTYATWRWDTLGPRDNTIEDLMMDGTVGITGQINDAVSLEVYAQYGKYVSTGIGSNYLSYGGLAINNEWYGDLIMDSEEAIANLRATTVTDEQMDTRKLFAGSQIDFMEMPGGTASAYIGLEHMEIEYSSLVDAQSEAGWIGGSAGNSAQGSRDLDAIFTEFLLPVTDSIEVNLAVRYDDYSDFGSATSPKVGINYRPLDNLTLKASWGQGFKAPALSDLYGVTSFSAEDATDYVYCAANGIPSDSCIEEQFDTYFGSNPDLDAEESEAYTAGVIYDVNDMITLGIEYFNLSVDNVIQTVGAQDMIFAELAGLSHTVTRLGNGQIDEIRAGTVNGPGFELQTLDFSAKGSYATEFGEFGFNVLFSHLIEYSQQAYFGAEVQDHAGWNLYPEWKGTLGLNWTQGNHRVDWYMSYTGSHAAENLIDEDGSLLPPLKPEGELDSWLVHNVAYNYTFNNDHNFRVGVRNLLDEDPVLDKNGEFSRDHYDLYNNFGRVYFAEYSVDL
ncbi:TonB-dependent receptor plug domain-containing protein [Microbulbifer thermotolerans]|nr:TonB-dependent receptor [Microbulbifer thermotolerans]MCX2780908.1 TonB-dependent receptor [Microbulbifer thermotolerans]MCX2806636.1 TonB-dependent receptor [Microbulbifer thermotolerans]WKT59805.1 TonB-dependent receptor [Microbulbifer thermotolerans]SFC59659.1 iron complex outermembrane recepter protein [Microbulbifer thermotolerans]